MRNWVEWHDGYERPGSPLASRLEVVRRHLRTALEAVGPSVTILSLCSGDGRDVIGVLADHPATVRRAVLVDNDETLARRARTSAAAAGLDQVEVRCRDAGALESFADVVPVDVLLICGIFGNIEHRSVKDLVDLLPGLVKPGGCVLWTRGGSDPDRRPEIRTWFAEAGLEEMAFDGAPEPYGVGLNRVPGSNGPARCLPQILFRFQ